jgi:hypothetical protein
MKKRKIKRIIYTSPASGETFFGATEYDGNLTDHNILGAFHEVGKTAWVGNTLWVVRDNELIYRLSIEESTQYTKTWWDYLIEAIRRI